MEFKKFWFQDIKDEIIYNIYLVDGEYIRNNLSVNFMGGGNPLAYTFIPDNEIWIENINNSDKDKWFILQHEFFELGFLKKGNTYDMAHDKANTFEAFLRGRTEIIECGVKEMLNRIEESKVLSKKIFTDIWKKLSGLKVNRQTLNFVRDITSSMISSTNEDEITFANIFMQTLLGQLKDEVNIPHSLQKIRSHVPTMEDILNDVLRAMKDYRGYVLESKIKESDELGLVKKTNLDGLLNNDKLQSYFSNPDHFDMYYQDIQEFFKQDILTNNQLQKYLSSLNYGDKTIALTLEILSKSKEEKKAENPKKAFY